MQDGGGLSLKRSETGGRWTFRFQINGKRRDMGLGSYPDMSLSDARKERSKWAAFAERGEDPIVERERQRLEEENSQNDPTFEEMAEMVFEGRKERLRGEESAACGIHPSRTTQYLRSAIAGSAPCTSATFTTL